VLATAAAIFDEGAGAVLEERAEQLARRFGLDPDYDPVSRSDAVEAVVRGRLLDEDPRVVPRVLRRLPAHVRESGAYARAELGLQQQARELVARLSRLERDRLGFAEQTATREALLSPYLLGVPVGRRAALARRVSRVEEADTPEREARYATAARTLLRRTPHAEVSRRLGLSSTELDRLVRAYPRDVPLAPDDPIRTLAPYL
jgi:hypothetical protein